MDRAAAATMMKKPTARTVSSLATYESGTQIQCDESVSSGSGRKDEADAGGCTKKTSGSFDNASTSLKPVTVTMTHVKLGADGSGGQTGSEDDTSSLGEEVGLGDRVDDAGSLLIGGRLCSRSSRIRIWSKHIQLTLCSGGGGRTGSHSSETERDKEVRDQSRSYPYSETKPDDSRLGSNNLLRGSDGRSTSGCDTTTSLSVTSFILLIPTGQSK